MFDLNLVAYFAHAKHPFRKPPRELLFLERLNGTAERHLSVLNLFVYLVRIGRSVRQKGILDVAKDFRIWPGVNGERGSVADGTNSSDGFDDSGRPLLG